MKVKEPSAKTGLHLHIKKTRSMATEEIHSLSTDREDMQIVRDFAHFVSAVNSNGDAAEKSRAGWDSEERARAAMEESEKVTKIQDVPSERRPRSSTPSHSQLPRVDAKTGYGPQADGKNTDSSEVGCWRGALQSPWIQKDKQSGF